MDYFLFSPDTPEEPDQKNVADSRRFNRREKQGASTRRTKLPDCRDNLAKAAA